MPKQILSCPFCGCQEIVIARTNPQACWVECAYCGAQANGDPERSKAITNWNQTVARSQATIVEDGDADYWESVQRIRQMQKGVKR